MQSHGRTGTENALNRRDYYRFTTTPGGSPLAGDYECLYVFRSTSRVLVFLFPVPLGSIVPRHLHLLPLPRFGCIATVLELVPV